MFPGNQKTLRWRPELYKNEKAYDKLKESEKLKLQFSVYYVKEKLTAKMRYKIRKYMVVICKKRFCLS